MYVCTMDSGANRHSPLLFTPQLVPDWSDPVTRLRLPVCKTRGRKKKGKNPKRRVEQPFESSQNNNNNKERERKREGGRKQQQNEKVGEKKEKKEQEKGEREREKRPTCRN